MKLSGNLWFSDNFRGDKSKLIITQIRLILEAEFGHNA